MTLRLFSPSALLAVAFATAALAAPSARAQDADEPAEPAVSATAPAPETAAPAPAPSPVPAAAASAQPVVQTTPLTPSGNPNERLSQFNFPSMPLSMVIPELENLTGRTVLRQQGLPNVEITLVFKIPPTRGEALQALETVLNLNQIALVPLGDKFVKMLPMPSVRFEAPLMIDGTALDHPPSGRVATKLFQLEFLRVAEFVPQIATLLNASIGSFSLFEKANAVLITDSISTLQRIEVLVKKLDQPISAGMSTKFYTLRFAKASDLVAKLRAILQGPLLQQLSSATTYNADDRTNQIVLICDARQFPFFDDLVNKLDVKADPNTRTEVIHLNNANAKEVATLLSTLVAGQIKAAQQAQAASTSANQRQQRQQQQQQQAAARTTQAANRPAAQPAVTTTTINLPGNINVSSSEEFSTLITIQPDERSNAVVVSGTVDDIRIIQELVAKIDILLAQVRIEVVIAEVSLTDTDESGISSLGLTVRNGKLVGVNAGGAGFTVGGEASGGFPAVGHTGLLGSIGLTTTPRKSNTKIISTPSIVTAHNKEAFIKVGEKRPVISGYQTDSSTLTGSRSTVTQQDIGLELKVKPLIGKDGSVQMEITQTVQNIKDTTIIDGNEQPIVGNREAQSFINVYSGEIVVLGGLQEQSDTKSRTRLGPIPLIGDLLGTRKKEKRRSDLIFFIRPTVLTSASSDNASAYQRMDTMENLDPMRSMLGVPENEKLPGDTGAPAKTGPAMKRPR
ncbi:MAG: type II secretory pathway, component PulD [Opitutaceae bacterium]|jgi:general secretion pathway protein D|nr:type II secretory pathway, component PulD [Opitutaceae bacterium]